MVLGVEESRWAASREMVSALILAPKKAAAYQRQERQTAPNVPKVPYSVTERRL